MKYRCLDRNRSISGKPRRNVISFLIGITFAVAVLANPPDSRSAVVTRRKTAPATARGIEKIKSGYLLITDQSCIRAFAPLVDRRRSQGFEVQIISISEVQKRYKGKDCPEQIRKCIQDVYSQQHRLYVVLGGDDTIVPVRYCYDKKGTHDREYCLHLPTDLYYADMDGGTWDADHDGIYGEMGDDDTEVDLTPEVFLGRIAVRTPDEAAAYAAKVIQYEQTNPDGFADTMILIKNTEYLKKVYEQHIKPHWQASVLCIVDKDSEETAAQIDGCLPPTGGRRFRNGLPGLLNAGYNHVVYSGHGSPTSWPMGKDSSVGRVNVSRVMNLINWDRLSIIRSGGCGCAWFDGPNDPGLCEAFLRNPRGGAVVFVGFSRTAYGGTGPQYQDGYYEELFRDRGVTVGEAFTRMKAAMAPKALKNRWHQYTYCLLGDPAIAPLWPRQR